MNKLSPCRFCNSSVQHYKNPKSCIWFFLCNTCGALTSFANNTVAGEYGKKESIERWNEKSND